MPGLSPAPERLAPCSAPAATPCCHPPHIGWNHITIGSTTVVLGGGTPPDVPSWGGMLSITDQKYIEVSPWLVFFPSLAISIAVFGFNLLGDGLRDALDPRLRGLQER
jgi:ABC-type microcin C transport system permease subunit YejE